MRILKYRQKLDSYQIMFWRLCLYDTDIIFNDSPDWNELEGYQQLALMAGANSEPPEINIDRKDFESLFKAIDDCEDFKDLRFGAISIKTHCIWFGFYTPSRDSHFVGFDEHDYLWIKIPLTGSSGSLYVHSMEDNDERYAINWKNGIITSFEENIKDEYRGYENISVDHPVYGCMGSFAITEATSPD